MPPIGLEIGFQSRRFIILDVNPSQNEVLLGKITPLWTRFQHYLNGEIVGTWYTWDSKAMQPCEIH